MNMKKNLSSSCVLGLSSLFSFSAHADWDFSSLDYRGSFLFCVNEDNKYQWEWAKENTDKEFKNSYDKIATLESSRGTWLRGMLAYNNRGSAVLDVKHTFDNFKEAKAFCSALVKTCTDQFGEKYSNVGVSSYVIPPYRWGLISVKYKVDTNENIPVGDGEDTLAIEKVETSSCQNWNYKVFPNDGGAYLTIGKIYN